MKEMSKKGGELTPTGTSPSQKLLRFRVPQELPKRFPFAQHRRPSVKLVHFLLGHLFERLPKEISHGFYVRRTKRTVVLLGVDATERTREDLRIRVDGAHFDRLHTAADAAVSKIKIIAVYLVRSFIIRRYRDGVDAPEATSRQANANYAGSASYDERRSCDSFYFIVD